MRKLRILFFVLTLHLSAEWDPELFLSDDDLPPVENADETVDERRKKALSVLEDPHFKALKENMVRYLQDSWCSAEKVRLMMDVVCLTKPKLCVEIGAFSGASVLPVAVTLEYLGEGMVVAVDAWSNAVAIRNMAFDDPNRPWWSAVDMEGVHDLFQRRLWEQASYNYWDEIRASSEEASAYFDEIDFLHLDGDYTEKGSLQDVHLYLPKVKQGGYILLSNLFIMVKGKAPKMKSFAELFDACEMVCEIDRDNVVLFRKI
jgi:hypothetical protein